MPPTTASGTYSLTQKLQTDAEFRAYFATPGDEGLDGDTSPVTTVAVGPCTGILSAPGPGRRHGGQRWRLNADQASDRSAAWCWPWSSSPDAAPDRCRPRRMTATASAATASVAPSASAEPSTALASPTLATTAPPPTPSPSPTGDPPAPTGPPAASLTVDGGDPVTGQLGTYLWMDGGSDSPWLPGAEVAVGIGEPFVVSLDPSTGVAAWRARLGPAGADRPAQTRIVGEGVDEPRLVATEAGRWLLVIDMTFARRRGSASYFWELDVQ